LRAGGANLTVPTTGALGPFTLDGAKHDLVDEMRLMVFPVVLRTGKRLFGGTTDKKPLRLADSKVVGDGVVILTYEAAADRE
jgi:dihydrofolate reductase